MAAPGAMPVTSPDDETVATAAFELDHVNVVAVPGGLAVAANCTVAPTSTVALDGDTEIDFTCFPPPPPPPPPPLAKLGAPGSTEFGADASEHATKV